MDKAPRPYQDTGIDFLARNPSALLGDDAGVGKSLQMIRAANAAGARRLLILCPSIGRVSWPIQLREWDLAPRPAFFFPEQSAGIIPDGPLALIVTYDFLSTGGNTASVRAALDMCEPFDFAILDEAHGLKNPAAKRTKAVYGKRMDRVGGLIDGIPRVVAASATFTPRHAGELYPHLRALLPDVLKSLFNGRIVPAGEFERTFCRIVDTGFGLAVDGNNPVTIPALRRALEPYFLARMKKDVIEDMPALSCVPLPLDVSGPELRELARNAYLDSLPTDIVDADTDELTALGVALSDPRFSVARRALGLVKAKAAARWAADFLDADPARSLIVFAHHSAVLDFLHAQLEGFAPVRVSGGMSRREAAAAVDTFQGGGGSCRLFLGQTKAAGTSITLTRSSYVLLVEPDPTNDANYQAICRAWRMGQTEPVTAYFASAAGTADDRLSALARRRARQQIDLFGTAGQGHV